MDKLGDEDNKADSKKKTTKKKEDEERKKERTGWIKIGTSVIIQCVGA